MVACGAINNVPFLCGVQRKGTKRNDSAQSPHGLRPDLQTSLRSFLQAVLIRLFLCAFCFHMPRRAMRPMLSRIAFRSQPPLGDPALPDEEPRGFRLRPQRRKQTGAGKSKLCLLEQSSPFSIVCCDARLTEWSQERDIRNRAYIASAVG